jgi:predicted AAA+ superfamily ATPase
MKYLDVDLETDRTYSGIVASDYYEKGGIGYNINECAKATKIKFGKYANQYNPTPEQKDFMVACLKGKEENNKVENENNNTDAKKENKNNILIYSAIGLGVVAIYMLLLKR